jgi:hypothetical protein
MYGLMTSQSDWDEIAKLAAGKDVVQLGFGYGNDTAFIAGEAARVVAIAQAPRLDHEGYANALTAWADIVRFYGRRERVLHSFAGLEDIDAQFLPHQFDVAVVDLNAFRHATLTQVLTQAFHLAPVVAVMQPAAWSIDAHMQSLGHSSHVLDHTDGLYVLRPRTVSLSVVPAEAI